MMKSRLSMSHVMQYSLSRIGEQYNNLDSLLLLRKDERKITKTTNDRLKIFSHF